MFSAADSDGGVAVQAHNKNLYLQNLNSLLDTLYVYI